MRAPPTTLFERLSALGSIHEAIAADVPAIARGQVWCRGCGRTQRVDDAQCLRTGWPKCCGATMTIDPPDNSRPSPADPANQGA